MKAPRQGLVLQVDKCTIQQFTLNFFFGAPGFFFLLCLFVRFFFFFVFGSGRLLIFGVLELLLHDGPLPVNTIGPIVDLTPGSISIAVDRLVGKGLVSRVESAEDRRVRIVALTPRGKDLIVSAFRKHSGQMKKVFSELNPEELHSLEVKLKRLGKRAAALMEKD